MTPSKPAPETVERIARVFQRHHRLEDNFQVCLTLADYALLALTDDDIRELARNRGIGSWEAGRETAAQLAETEINYYIEGMSVVDVRFSFQRGPKWKDGPAIASAIRAILPPAPGETK